ncbi:putative apoptosis-antagonizing transcription factor [Hamiltosporidium tvaerminnensis]|uniref:Putative apoptosis-antagonizing transcription factor n=1 Tax=Hamiltosporidium tvaerminnensis TaxID=1176355 RepID=A0A4Q9LMV0_9MICR|nr:putative apoptosis-antagonizing transcription factor [Hamiltosporidium tvaerminnensis]
MPKEESSNFNEINITELQRKIENLLTVRIKLEPLLQKGKDSFNKEDLSTFIDLKEQIELQPNLKEKTGKIINKAINSLNKINIKLNCTSDKENKVLFGTLKNQINLMTEELKQKHSNKFCDSKLFLNLIKHRSERFNFGKKSNKITKNEKQSKNKKLSYEYHDKMENFVVQKGTVQWPEEKIDNLFSSLMN